MQQQTQSTGYYQNLLSRVYDFQTNQQVTKEQAQKIKQLQLKSDKNQQKHHQEEQLLEYKEQTMQQQQMQIPQRQEYQPLNDYIISKTLGKGNFGKVKLALHKLTQQHVAVKILEKDLIFQNTDIVRISRQLKIMKKLRHPFVVQLYQIIQTQKQLYLIMEYAQKGDLFDKIVKEQRIKQKQACKIYAQIALGMQYMHDKGVSHRDLKPQNILMNRDGNIKIADFGLGNMFKPEQKLKTACGSPCYASPEMLNKQAYDPKKIDIWSTGIILYAMVCGYLPFEDQITSKLYEKIKTANIKLPSGVSSPCRNLIRGLLTKDPKLRFDVDSILSHQMLTQHVLQLKQFIKQNELTTDKIEEICERYDIEEKQKLVTDLGKNRHNNLTTLYYLGVRRLQKEVDQDEDEEFMMRQNQKIKMKGNDDNLQIGDANDTQSNNQNMSQIRSGSSDGQHKQNKTQGHVVDAVNGDKMRLQMQNQGSQNQNNESNKQQEQVIGASLHQESRQNNAVHPSEHQDNQHDAFPDNDCSWQEQKMMEDHPDQYNKQDHRQQIDMSYEYIADQLNGNENCYQFKQVTQQNRVDRMSEQDPEQEYNMQEKYWEHQGRQGQSQQNQQDQVSKGNQQLSSQSNEMESQQSQNKRAQLQHIYHMKQDGLQLNTGNKQDKQSQTMQIQMHQQMPSLKQRAHGQLDVDDNLIKLNLSANTDEQNNKSSLIVSSYQLSKQIQETLQQLNLINQQQQQTIAHQQHKDEQSAQYRQQPHYIQQSEQKQLPISYDNLRANQQQNLNQDDQLFYKAHQLYLPQLNDQQLTQTNQKIQTNSPIQSGSQVQTQQDLDIGAMNETLKQRAQSEQQKPIQTKKQHQEQQPQDCVQQQLAHKKGHRIHGQSRAQYSQDAQQCWQSSSKKMAKQKRGQSVSNCKQLEQGNQPQLLQPYYNQSSYVDPQSPQLEQSPLPTADNQEQDQLNHPFRNNQLCQSDAYKQNQQQNNGHQMRPSYVGSQCNNTRDDQLGKYIKNRQNQVPLQRQQNGVQNSQFKLNYTKQHNMESKGDTIQGIGQDKTKQLIQDQGQYENHLQPQIFSIPIKLQRQQNMNKLLQSNGQINNLNQTNDLNFNQKLIQGTRNNAVSPNQNSSLTVIKDTHKAQTTIQENAISFNPKQYSISRTTPINPLQQPQQLQLNQRSHSKDTPIVFKSNRIPKALTKLKKQWQKPQITGMLNKLSKVMMNNKITSGNNKNDLFSPKVNTKKSVKYGDRIKNFINNDNSNGKNLGDRQEKVAISNKDKNEFSQIQVVIGQHKIGKTQSNKVSAKTCPNNTTLDKHESNGPSKQLEKCTIIKPNNSMIIPNTSVIIQNNLVISSNEPIIYPKKSSTLAVIQKKQLNSPKSPLAGNTKCDNTNKLTSTNPLPYSPNNTASLKSPNSLSQYSTHPWMCKQQPQIISGKKAHSILSSSFNQFNKKKYINNVHSNNQPKITSKQLLPQVKINSNILSNPQVQKMNKSLNISHQDRSLKQVASSITIKKESNNIYSKKYTYTKTKNNRQSQEYQQQKQKASDSGKQRLLPSQVVQGRSANIIQINSIQAQPSLINPELILFTSCNELANIIDQLHLNSDSPGSTLTNLTGSIYVYPYQQKDYMYLVKSDLYKFTNQPVHSNNTGYQRPINSKEQESFNKTFSTASIQITIKSVSQHNPVKIKINKIESFQFVQLINSLILER